MIVVIVGADPVVEQEYSGLQGHSYILVLSCLVENFAVGVMSLVSAAAAAAAAAVVVVVVVVVVVFGVVDNAARWLAKEGTVIGVVPPRACRGLSAVPAENTVEFECPASMH